MHSLDHQDGTRTVTSHGSDTGISIIPRNIHFAVCAGDTRYWLDGDPVATAVFNALSLTFPGGERLFIDALRAFSGKVDGRLQEDIRAFISQEAIHSREHHLFNGLIDAEHYPVSAIETEIRAQIEFARSGGAMQMLMATVCLEHFTAMLADMRVLHSDLFTRTNPSIDRLWRWHAMEETEHKAVSYDVFMAVTQAWPRHRRYFRRCLAMAVISWNFTRNIARYSARMLEADGYSPKAARKAVSHFLWGRPALFGRGWKIWISWFRPGFHPWDHDNQELMETWRKEFDTAAA